MLSKLQHSSAFSKLCTFLSLDRFKINKMSAFDQNPYSSLDEDNDARAFTDDEDDSLYSYDAEAEWEESKEQLSALFSMVIFPFVGKWLGKKFSFWLWSRYLGSSTPFTQRYSILSTQMVNSVKRIA